MAREITEETGLHVKAASLIDLGTYYFSPGACSEQITLYCCELEMSIEKILALDKRLAGLREHGENIKVRLCAFNKFERLNINIRDAKTQLAYELYLRKYGCKK